MSTGQEEHNGQETLPPRRDATAADAPRAQPRPSPQPSQPTASAAASAAVENENANGNGSESRNENGNGNGNENGNGNGDGDFIEGTAPPDSPPLPSRHTAVTPGPRAARLQQLFASTLQHTLDKVARGDNFGACFPTVAARAPGTLEFVQRQMVERLRGLCEKEFDSILQNRNVVPKLNELESLLSDAATRKLAGEASGEVPVPPHTLPASAVLDAHLAPHLAAQQSQLNARLQTVQSRNAQLFDDIQAQRAEIEALLGAVERTLADMDSASALLDGVADDLAQETRTAEVEMTGT